MRKREFGYAGYARMLELLRRPVLTLEGPVRDTVRALAPWEARKLWTESW